MKLSTTFTTYLLALATTVTATYNPYPYDHVFQKRAASPSNSSLEVDLGYEIYRGISNKTSGLNIFRGYPIVPQYPTQHLTNNSTESAMQHPQPAPSAGNSPNPLHQTETPPSTPPPTPTYALNPNAPETCPHLSHNPNPKTASSSTSSLQTTPQIFPFSPS